MKILHVGPVTLRNISSGVKESICGSISAQAAIGLEVGLLSSIPLTQEERFAEKLPGVCLVGSLSKRHLNPWFVSRNWIERIHENFGKPDLVVFHSVYIPFQVALARRCRQVGWPYIATVHGGLAYLAQKFKRTKKRIANLLFFRSFVENAVAIHAISEMEAAQIQPQFDVKKTFIVPNGVDERLFEIEDRFTPADLGDFANKTDLMLGFVGRLEVNHKGLDFLLDAMAILKSWLGGLKCKLFMVGPFHSKKDQDYILSAIKSLGLENMVKLCGPKYDDEKWSYFLACDVFVHPSRYEAGVPISLLEAMALGRPCLAAPGANIDDIIREDGAWGCEPDPESIANVIMDIYKSRESLPVVGQHLKDFAYSRFTWRKVAEQLREKYSDILADLS